MWIEMRYLMRNLRNLSEFNEFEVVIFDFEVRTKHYTYTFAC